MCIQWHAFHVRLCDKINQKNVCICTQILTVFSFPHFTSSLSACATSSISVYYIPFSQNYNFWVRTTTTLPWVFLQAGQNNVDIRIGFMQYSFGKAKLTACLCYKSSLRLSVVYWPEFIFLVGKIGFKSNHTSTYSVQVLSK